MTQQSEPIRIAVIGTGYVGIVSGTGLAEIGHTVTCVDRNPEKVDKMRQGISPIYEPGLEEYMKRNIEAGRLSFTSDLPEAVSNSDIIMITVGTPSRSDGKADLTHIANAAKQVAKASEGYKVVVNKSTVPVGTGKRVEEILRAYNDSNAEFDVVSNPEFLREGSAVEDFMKPDRIVVGVSTERAKKLMQQVYLPFDKQIVITDVSSAEIIKYASNSFLATKISFANSVARICELTGANVDDVVSGMGFDRRIGSDFLHAGVGWGGSCFPKDVSAFIESATEHGYDFRLLTSAEEVNRDMRRHFIQTIENALWVLRDKTVAVWGLAFKPNTDDMRCAPSVDIINHLRTHGATIRAHDPVASNNAQEIFGNDNITYCSSPNEAVEGADALVIMTDWDEYKSADLTTIKKLLLRPLVIDGRNIFKPNNMKDAGFEYYSIGRPKNC